MAVSYYTKDDGLKLAYVHVPASGEGENLPAVMFLGGFKSDMEGTKALYLEEQCRMRGQEFVRFDYSGHGESEGEFVDGTISAWAGDAWDILDNIVTRDVILVGSSMGGWISLLLLLERSECVKGVVGIAAAPDFTKDIEAEMSNAEQEMMERQGRLEVPNDYSDEPYIFTKALIEDGRERSLLNKTYRINVPLVLIQGKLDEDVKWEKAVLILTCFQGPDTQVVFVEEGDHRLSRDQDLALIGSHVTRLSTS